MKTKETTLKEEITIVPGINCKFDNFNISLEKGSDKISRKINNKLKVEIDGNKIIITANKNSKREKKILGSESAHIKNIISGLNEKFKYKLLAANVHFPMNLAFDKEKNELVVKNFLGEKKDRRIKILDGVSVKITKELIELESCDIEKAGQSAANIEKGTKVRKRDRRIFQDGIYITEKPGKVFL
ncbi:MAG: 50S ribosomal protein L6 [Candidatus Pacearchaeota archaeon]|jgi:large subunit ribosomal protein L6